MLKLLAIGNSFSQDATVFLHDMAERGGIAVKVVNLFIGGCSLKTHWENIVNNKHDYTYMLNGINIRDNVSLREALLEEDWDFVTLQQLSDDSGFIDTYLPYIYYLYVYVKQYSHNSAVYLHQTWPYEIDSSHEAFVRYHNDQNYMHTLIRGCYNALSQALNVPIIPTGEVIQALRRSPHFNHSAGGQSLCRDGYHLDLTYGRYAAAAAWYETLLQGNILMNDYLPCGEICANDELITLIKETVHNICGMRGMFINQERIDDEN